MIMAQMTYAINPPIPALKNVNNAHIMRIKMGSILKYSAIPPQTPLITLLVVDL